MSSIYAEVRNDFYNEEEKKIYIDAWKTGDDNEEGTVVAKIDAVSLAYEFLVPEAENDEKVREAINQALDELEEQRSH